MSVDPTWAEHNCNNVGKYNIHPDKCSGYAYLYPDWQRVACIGTATQCRGVPCWGSPGTIGDILPYKDKAGNPISIADINSIWSNGREIGWLYVGSDMSRWIQANYASGATLNGSFSVGFSFIIQGSVGGGVNAPSGYSPISPFSGRLGAVNATPTQCESKSGTFV